MINGSQTSCRRLVTVPCDVDKLSAVIVELDARRSMPLKVSVKRRRVCTTCSYHRVRTTDELRCQYRRASSADKQCSPGTRVLDAGVCSDRVRRETGAPGGSY